MQRAARLCGEPFLKCRESILALTWRLGYRSLGGLLILSTGDEAKGKGTDGHRRRSLVNEDD